MTHTPSKYQLERVAYRRSRAIRSAFVAALSTLVLGTLLVVAITGAPGWQRVKETFFSAAAARSSLPSILDGLLLNLRLLVFCAAGALVLGLLIALLKTLRGALFFPVRMLANAYTYGFRGVPLIILLYVLCFGVPGLRLSGTPSVLVLGGAAIVLTYGAFLAEVFRAGIESVHPSQRAAARSLGLTYWQAMRHVVLPQAVRRVAPPLLNDMVSMQKDVGLVSIGGVIDAVRAAQIEVAQTYNYTPYIVAGVLFVLLAVPVIAITDWVTLRAARRQSAGSTT
ncbi:amino acid ABC transporter permease [Longispora albida]|uniref:amino acid ABC transporter permease n=1 Tax=Longispora albida TaxID=203523 RepID=UPI00039DBDAB|nr:amino acid ABC transporter permease [Longispora albida]